ncbi:hypothetical protein BDR26DRAFT_855660 [Obelidium mucronatum]|nr:hypothetical protein BDR26DRAFT_855660 [Obelidium mucronatum]
MLRSLSRSLYARPLGAADHRRRVHFGSIVAASGGGAGGSGGADTHSDDSGFPDSHYPQLGFSLASITLGIVSAHVARSTYLALSSAVAEYDDGNGAPQSQGPSAGAGAGAGGSASASASPRKALAHKQEQQQRQVQMQTARQPPANSMAKLRPPTNTIATVQQTRPHHHHQQKRNQPLSTSNTLTAPKRLAAIRRTKPTFRRIRQRTTLAKNIPTSSAEENALQRSPEKPVSNVMADLAVLTQNYAHLSTSLLYLNQTLFHHGNSTVPKALPKSLDALHQLLLYMQTHPHSASDKKYIRLLKAAAKHGSLLAKYNLAVCCVQTGELEIAMQLFADVVGSASFEALVGIEEKDLTDSGSKSREMYSNALFNLRVLVAEGVGRRL